MCGRAVRACLHAALLLAAVGCADDNTPRLADYLEELEFDAPLESAAYVPLGAYEIPVAYAPADAESGGGPVWMRLSFELLAETAPEHESAVATAAQRRRGDMNDAVLSIVRNSSVDEITDVRLAAIKSRMTQAARSFLGADRVRQLVLNNTITEAL